MIINNLYIMGIFFLPYETNAPLIIDSDAVLVFSVAS